VWTVETGELWRAIIGHISGWVTVVAR